MMSEYHICFCMLWFHVNRHGSWFQQRISWRFCSSRTTSFVHTNTILSTWRHSSVPTTWWGTTCQLALYMFKAGSRSDKVDQFTKFIGIVATMDYSAIPPHLLDHVATKLAVAPLLRQSSCQPKFCRAHHYEWRGTVIRGALRATRH